MWMAGGGIKPGLSYGQTDDYCYNIVRDPVHIHDLNATVLRQLLASTMKSSPTSSKAATSASPTSTAKS